MLVAFLPLLPLPIIAQATPQVVFQIVIDPGLGQRRIPYSLALPKIADRKPSRGSILPQDARYSRVSRIIGLGGQCVTVAQNAGFDIHAGAARNWPTVALALGYKVDLVPSIGAVVVTNESSYGTNTGHLALVKQIEENYVYVVESNYLSLTVTEGWMPVTSAVAFIHPMGD